ncbi:MAG TPA: DNA recombination protein RmuC [Candidatus Lumbricidophila sp.]|nr:DNA recombination protein RmuC [Candidatus Lumbricidophila sp.]
MDVSAIVLAVILGALIGAGAVFALVRTPLRAARAHASERALADAEHQRALLELRANGERAVVEARMAEQAVTSAVRVELAAALGSIEALSGQVRAAHERVAEYEAAQVRAHEERIARERTDAELKKELAPMKQLLDDLGKRSADNEKQQSEHLGRISEQLKQAQQSDEQLRVTTESLASALRSNSTRGVWGETQLRRVVEAAGLLQHVDFFQQATISTDAGTGRPDMVVNMPGGKYIPLDSKVPLEHFLEASAIPETATGEEGARRKTLIEKHVKAMRSHIDALARKSYWAGFDSPEFVIAFIPNESLLSAALEADPSLLNYALDKRVALTSPVNLFAVLKTVDYSWQQQQVSDEAKKLFALGNLLYERVGTLAKHAVDMRNAIERTVKTYNSFAGSLESRVLTTARQFPGISEQKLEALAVPAMIDESPRGLTAPEFTAPEVGAPELAAAESAFDDSLFRADVDADIRNAAK